MPPRLDETKKNGDLPGEGNAFRGHLYRVQRLMSMRSEMNEFSTLRIRDEKYPERRLALDIH